MNHSDPVILLKKITEIFIGAYDFRRLAREAVDLIIKELKEQNVVTVGIGRLHEKDSLLYAYAYATKYRRTIDKLLPAKFSELYIALDRTDNLCVRTVTTNQIQQSEKISDFSRGILPDTLMDKIFTIMQGRLGISFPIRVRSGKVAGVLLLILSQPKITGQQLVLFETLADQLGLAFSNVMAFEKLMEKYQQGLKKELANLNLEDIPAIKFTLRITPKENKTLERLMREQGKTKAEIIRELLDKLDKIGP